MTDQNPSSPRSPPKLGDCYKSSRSCPHKPFGRSKDKTLNIFSRSLRGSDDNNLPTSYSFSKLMRILAGKDLSSNSPKSLINAEKRDLRQFLKNAEHTEPPRSPEDSDLSIPCNSVKPDKFADGISLYSPESLKKSEDGTSSSSYKSPRASAGLELANSPCQCGQLSCNYGLLANCKHNISPVSSCSTKSFECYDCTPPSCDSNPVCCFKIFPHREVYEKKRKMLKCRCAQKYKIWCNHLKERRKISRKIMKKTGKTYCSLLLNSLHQCCPLQLCQKKQQKCISPPSTQQDDTLSIYMDNCCVDNLDADAKHFSEVAHKLYQNLDECRRRIARTHIIKFLSDILFSQYSEP